MYENTLSKKTLWLMLVAILLVVSGYATAASNDFQRFERIVSLLELPDPGSENRHRLAYFTEDNYARWEAGKRTVNGVSYDPLRVYSESHTELLEPRWIEYDISHLGAVSVEGYVGISDSNSATNFPLDFVIFLDGEPAFEALLDYAEDALFYRLPLEGVSKIRFQWSARRLANNGKANRIVLVEPLFRIGKQTVGAYESKTKVAVVGEQITINGEVATLWGLRLGGVPLSDEWTDEVIQQLDVWKSYGINSLAIWLQGTAGGYIQLFSEDGKEFLKEDPIRVKVGVDVPEEIINFGITSGEKVIARTRRLIEAADEKGMVVIVGIGYFPSMELADFTSESLINAMKLVAEPFKDYENIIFNVWNQPDGRDLETVEELIAYSQAIKEVAPERLVGCGGRTASFNLEVGAAPTIDMVLTDAGRNYKAVVKGFTDTRPVNKPIVNVLPFGSRANAYVDDLRQQVAAPEGYYLDFSFWRRVYGAWEEEDYREGSGKQSVGRQGFIDLIDFVGNDKTKQIHIMLHVSGWFGGLSRVNLESQLRADGTISSGTWGNTFSLGYGDGDGTVENPGIKWLLERIKVYTSD